MGVAGGREGGVRRERRRREFLMGSLNGKVFTLPAEATAATALHDSTYVFPRIRVHSTCYKSHAHTHSTHTHTDTHAVAARRQENVVVSATDQKFQVFEWKRETPHCCQGECWPAVPLPHPFFSFSPDKWAACLLRWLKCFASACHLNFNAMDRNVCNKLKGCTGA